MGLLLYPRRRARIEKRFCTCVHSTGVVIAIRRDYEDLTVITKTYDLILWFCHHTGKFPRTHRLVLGEQIERNLYHVLETLIRAKYTRQPHELLGQAKLSLEILRFQMRL